MKVVILFLLVGLLAGCRLPKSRQPGVPQRAETVTANVAT